SLGIMTLDDGKVTVIAGVRTFQLPEDNGSGVVYHKLPPPAATAEKKDDESKDDDELEFDFQQKGKGGKKGGGIAPAKGGPAAAPARPSDLVIHNFLDGSEVTIADVTDFTLSRDGKLLVCVLAP